MEENIALKKPINDTLEDRKSFTPAIVNASLMSQNDDGSSATRNTKAPTELTNNLN